MHSVLSHDHATCSLLNVMLFLPTSYTNSSSSSHCLITNVIYIHLCRLSDKTCHLLHFSCFQIFEVESFYKIRSYDRVMRHWICSKWYIKFTCDYTLLAKACSHQVQVVHIIRCYLSFVIIRTLHLCIHNTKSRYILQPSN